MSQFSGVPSLEGLEASHQDNSLVNFSTQLWFMTKAVWSTHACMVTWGNGTIVGLLRFADTRLFLGLGHI